jgi:hypothetical protein
MNDRIQSNEIRSNGRISVLSVAQDNLFAEFSECEVDHVATGTTITPVGAQNRRAFRRLPAVMARISRGKYDLIVLPAIDFRWPYDNSIVKRMVRSVLSALSGCRPLRTAASRLLSRRSTKVIVLDRYDSHEPLVDYLDRIPCARFYFKTNLRVSDSNRIYKTETGEGCRFRFLPYWVPIENYDVPRGARDFDVFFAGAVNCEQRRCAIDTIRRLEPEGFRIKIVEGHLPFSEYLSLMSRSWLTLSPQGYGYNGFRHYESMLVGSVPLINLSDPPIINDFNDGQNCFLYSATDGNLNDVVRNALRDKDRLRRMSQSLREFVVGKHSMQAVGSYLLSQAFANGQRQ